MPTTKVLFKKKTISDSSQNLLFSRYSNSHFSLYDIVRLLQHRNRFVYLLQELTAALFVLQALIVIFFFWQRHDDASSKNVSDVTNLASLLDAIIKYFYESISAITPVFHQTEARLTMLLLSITLQLLTVAARRGRGAIGRAAAPGGTLQGTAIEGENLVFWRLHCNVLA